MRAASVAAVKVFCKVVMAPSPLVFDLVPDDRDGSGLRVWRGVSGQDLELKQGAGPATNHLHNILQGKTAGVHVCVATLGKGQDAVPRMKLAAHFRRCAR